MALLECKMDRSKPPVVLLLALLLGNTGSSEFSPKNNTTNVSTETPTPNSSTKLSPTPMPLDRKALPSHELAFVRVVWSSRDPCKGDVRVHTLRDNVDLNVCINSHYVHNLTIPCPKTQCEPSQNFRDSKSQSTGHFVHKNGSVTRQECQTLQLVCKGKRTSKSGEGYSGELVAYKAITGLLLVLVLGVILLRFGKPTYAAICKRLSQRRQTRWIGPTQSQSVYYHREQQAGLQPNNNTSKRHSYPAALEKLTVASSREPSSNRNSDYSYN